MEAVHRSCDRSWIDDKTIDVKEFRDKYREEFEFKVTEEKNKSFLKNLIPKSEYAEIEKQCGLDSMKCAYQDRLEMSNSINLPNDVINSLETLRAQAEDLRKRKSHQYAAAVYNAQKYYNYPRHKMLGVLKDIDNFPEVPVSTPEIVLGVQVFVPERRQDNKTNQHVKMPAFQIDQEFIVLGSQYLTELRDKIECISDKVVPGEFSDCPSAEQPITCKDLYKSGFFYINGTFYNDMRDKDCGDYSEIIIKWAERFGRIGPFRKALMENTKFIDLKIQLGYPYVYIHQGECEHIMVFSELRMFSKHDINNKSVYPLYVFVKPTKRIFCMVCHFYTTSWVVYDNKRLPENPFFFCKDCFLSFNYDQNNQKIGNFRAYRYPCEAKII